MLPFLKNRDEGGASGPVETLEREPDEGGDYDMLDAVAGDILAAIAAKDATLLKEALQAFADHIQSQDVVQDETLAEELP